MHLPLRIMCMNSLPARMMRAAEMLEPNHRPDDPFDCMVVLLDDVVQVIDLPNSRAAPYHDTTGSSHIVTILPIPGLQADSSDKYLLDHNLRFDHNSSIPWSRQYGCSKD
jgi:hypothetical protein